MDIQFFEIQFFEIQFFEIQFFEIQFFEIQFFEKTMKNNEKPWKTMKIHVFGPNCRSAWAQP